MNREPAWTLPEAMVALAVLALLGALAWRGGAESLALQRLQTASQRVMDGLEDGRIAALRGGRPCALRLGSAGWEAPNGSGLPGCLGVRPGLGSGVDPGRTELWLTHNLPDPVRFTANGLVLDGGTVWIRSVHTPLVRCVVVSLPLGVTRAGREGAAGCEPEMTP
jgi:type II secretory pathway pseudopilin PulG